MVSTCSDSVLSTASCDADQRLQTRIVTQLSQSHHQALRKLAVEVREGLVTLRGNVRWFYEKQVAIQHCQAEGARQLIDAVEVAAG
ncbi:BON domain-containing protein [Anatilimnocola floriformis]|uniref:BON domain-containing protein n=1 Tax=Anatilimnocola floriformis TaxID=2948575 RepID=UPI0020C38C97|nr:BON domain-containing protein [Anatilimnocola floriformis]